MNRALLVMDVIHELVHENGSVGKDGYYQHATEQSLLNNTSKLISYFRTQGLPIIYVVVGFSEDYKEWSPKTKLFKHVKDNRQAILGSWSTQMPASIAPLKTDPLIVKHRVDPFYGTNLVQLLANWQIEELILTGISTEFVVLATTLSAHDRDYNVTVIEDCVASSNETSHKAAMHIIDKLASVHSVESYLTRMEETNGSNV